MPSRKSEALKDRVKDIKNQKHLKFDDSDLNSRIAILKSQIKNCEFDLAGNFKNSITIENKLKNLKIRRDELLIERDKLNSLEIPTSNAGNGSAPLPSLPPDTTK